MSAICLQNKSRIEAYLRKNVYLHIYSIGDLDVFFWPDTVWYGWEKGGEIQAVALLYTASQDPTLLALSGQQDVMSELIRSIFHILPERFYAHLSPRVAEDGSEKHGTAAGYRLFTGCSSDRKRPRRYA